MHMDSRIIKAFEAFRPGGFPPLHQKAYLPDPEGWLGITHSLKRAAFCVAGRESQGTDRGMSISTCGHVSPASDVDLLNPSIERRLDRQAGRKRLFRRCGLDPSHVVQLWKHDRSLKSIGIAIM